ncbi:serine hydrolase [Microbulbifer bruguierae]|uniref:Serine hydrolase n=1 Tax=Microbulbifer bruguierae TaxID=3029061 RepID=A0ABY8N9X7_9GAMM|nr:serine hydrolase domain-containing protein [Microbulbifer bruguierae]WGL15229.1 serine hydrolase [Microbulbifer bruguierae]
MSDEQHRQLGDEIDQILRRTHTPGAAVALFEPDGSVWRYTAGFKNIERRERVEPDTIFRIGSVSKVFVSLAIMKLVADGKVSLQDRLVDVAPEIEFHNPWEKDHPLRVVHLLNHTSGWDAPHGPELTGRGGEPLSTKEVLALHPHSRESRWVPGTRSAYNNTGPLVAAYVVEKVSGTHFEDYVQTQFFGPLAMGDSGYYFDDQYRLNAADLYRGSELLPYWHLPNRAAGGMHGSLEDMIKFVRFMQSPNQAGPESILPEYLVRTMEQPSGSQAADAGLQVGWGMGLTSFHHKGVVLYGHEGALPGARALVVYEPHGNLGHVVLTNGNSTATAQIHKLLTEYGDGGQDTENVVVPAVATKADSTLAGFYRSISPVADRFRIANSLMPWKISVADSELALSPVLGGAPRTLQVSESGQYLQPFTGRAALVQTEDPLAGHVVHYGPMTLQKTNAVTALAPMVLLATWLVAILAGLVHSLIWLVRKLFRRGLSRADSSLRRWSLLPVTGLLMAGTGILMSISSSEPYALSASVTVPSLMVFAGPVVFLIGSLWSLRIWYRERFDAKAGFWSGHATLLIFLNVSLGLYLLSYGLIGTRLWA